jgi:glycosyltransferase involved in cell wall biosynthesis
MRVLYVQYTNPGAYPPIVRGAQLLAESGTDVLMLGTRVRGLDALDVDRVAGMRVELMEPAREGWRLKTHYARYAAWVAREGAAWRPDWIYASDVLAAPIALVLRAMTGARVVYHEHDAPSVDHDTWVMRRCLAARRRIAREAALAVVPNGERAQRLSRDVAGGRPVLTVWNCPRRPSLARRPRPPVDDEPLRVVFRGSINAERLPASVIHAMACTNASVTLSVAGYETVGSRGYVSGLLALAEELGLAARVRYLGALGASELADVCSQSDVGLALMPVGSTDENMCHMVGASNKVFEYLSCGVAPLVTDLPDWRTAFVAPGYALACDPASTASVQRVLEWAASHRSDLRAIAERGMARLLDDWNYESQFAPVLRAMQASVSPDRQDSAALGARGVRCAS